jgi:hypothetical protein
MREQSIFTVIVLGYEQSIGCNEDQDYLVLVALLLYFFFDDDGVFISAQP